MTVWVVYTSSLNQVDNDWSDRLIKVARYEQVGHMLKKWYLNHNSNNSISIHPLLDKPYIVPGTSPVVSSGFRILRSKMTIGGMDEPAALQQASIVMLALFPVHTTWECFVPDGATTFNDDGSRGMPLSSQLYICHGLS